jgi:hypothetical protein
VMVPVTLALGSDREPEQPRTAAAKQAMNPMRKTCMV